MLTETRTSVHPLRRLRGNMTTVELARRAEQARPDLPFVPIDRSYVYDIETGRNRNPSGLIVLRLADVLGCDPDDLYPTVDAPAEAGTDAAVPAA
jgi:transcriptional regulator with XRE-family HTH domain